MSRKFSRKFSAKILASGILLLFLWRFWCSRLESSLPVVDTVTRKPFFYKRHDFDCRSLWYNVSEPYTVKRPLIKDYDLWKRFGDCDLLFQFHYYPQRPLTSAEKKFPLAYVILVNEHLEQVEILLNSIYQPQNIYCFHVDLKSTLIFYSSMKRLASCFKNVFVVDRMVAVNPVSYSMILAQLECLKILTEPSILANFDWKYVILLQGHDFPLKTNTEIVEILTIHDGANDVELINEIAWRRGVRWEIVYDNEGLPIDLQETKEVKPEPPHNLTVYKGSIAATLSRPIVKFALESPIARDFLNWLSDAYMPDEIFWSTLNHNGFSAVDGGYPGRCASVDCPNGQCFKSWVSRFVVWQSYTHLECKSSNYRHSVCLFSLSSLPMLFQRPELFANKIWLTSDPVALDCAHELIFNRTYAGFGGIDPHFYANLSAVKYRAWKKENPEKKDADFECVVCENCQH